MRMREVEIDTYEAGRMPARQGERTMLKRDELSHPSSCLSRARDDEMIFVLLGRDPAAAATIRFWIQERIRLGKNRPSDPQIVGAEECAWAMERGRTIDGGPSSETLARE